MTKDIIITGFSNASKEGVTIHLNKKIQMHPPRGIYSDSVWLSWDAIGRKVFPNYTEAIEVADRDKLRQSSTLPTQEKQPEYEVSEVECNLCGNKLVAVRPEGLEKLECSKCNNVCSFNNK